MLETSDKMLYKFVEAHKFISTDVHKGIMVYDPNHELSQPSGVIEVKSSDKLLIDSVCEQQIKITYIYYDILNYDIPTKSIYYTSQHVVLPVIPDHDEQGVIDIIQAHLDILSQKNDPDQQFDPNDDLGNNLNQIMMIIQIWMLVILLHICNYLKSYFQNLK